MNTLKAKIKDIKSFDGVNLVSFDLFGKSLKMMSLELSSNIQINKEVKLGIAPSNIALAKNFSGELSYSNQLNLKIKNIQNGEILSNIFLENKDIELETIITKDSCLRMNLKENDEVTVLIKASHISILEVLDD